MQDGALMGARFDAKQKDGRFNVGGIGNPALSAQNDAVVLGALGIEDEKTVANELQTHLKVKGEAFSLGALLGTGMATRTGDNQSTIVSSALGEIRTLRQRAVATLDVFSDPSDATTLQSALRNLWDDVKDEVETIFGDKVSLSSARRDERILDDFDDIIDALSDVDGFQAATASGGGGVFAGAKLSADAAASAFEAEKVEATATFGVVGNTRFGAFWKKQRDDATSKLADPTDGNLGAFAYGTTLAPKTLRTRHVRQGTGNAYYAGRTEAVDGNGNFFSGDIEIQVRFAAERVNAVITNLTGETGTWEYLYGNTDVAEIILPDTRLGGNASWSGSNATSGATVVYSTRAGVPRPVEAPYSFKGQLLGRDSGNQGNEAVGVWSLGTSGNGKNYLAGGFGAVRGADLPDIRPEPDSGEGSQTRILPNGDIVPDPTDTEQTDLARAETHADNDASITRASVSTAGRDAFFDTDNPDTRGQTIAGGMLTVTGREFSGGAAVVRTDTAHGTIPSTNALGTFDHDSDAATDEIPVVNGAKYRAHKIDLAAALDQGVKWADGEKYVDVAKAAIEKQLRILESDIGLDESVKAAAWTAVKNAILNNLFTESAFTSAKGSAFVPDYSASSNDDFVRAATEAFEALQSNNALKAALASGGIFSGLAKANGKGAGNVDLFDRRNSRVQYAIGSTDFTRFGAWRRQTSPDAESGYANRTDTAEGDGPNSLAYSQLAPTIYQGLTDPRYPNGARMTYQGSTIAVLGGDFFEGALQIEVLWGQGVGVDATANTADDVIAATLNMSISDIENMADASPLYLDTAIASGSNATDDLQEVVSIGISNVAVDSDLKLAHGAGTGSTVDVRSFASTAVLPTSTPLHSNITDVADTVDAVEVMGQFVGLGVSGPLAVLGAWNMNADNGTAAIGAKVTQADDDGNVIGVSVTGADFDVDANGALTEGTFANGRIHGGFGAELP